MNATQTKAGFSLSDTLRLNRWLRANLPFWCKSSLRYIRPGGVRQVTIMAARGCDLVAYADLFRTAFDVLEIMPGKTNDVIYVNY